MILLSAEEEPIPISAVQHAVYCLRQAALIHVERQWADNRFTAEGDVLHAVTDKGGRRRLRGVKRVMSLPLASKRLNLGGVADLVEFISGPGEETAYPVEYKGSVSDMAGLRLAISMSYGVALEREVSS